MMMNDPYSVTMPPPTSAAKTGARDFTVRCSTRRKWNTCTHAELQRRGSMKALSSPLIDDSLQGLETRETKQNAAGLISHSLGFPFSEGAGGWPQVASLLSSAVRFRRDLTKTNPSFHQFESIFRLFYCYFSCLQKS